METDPSNEVPKFNTHLPRLAAHFEAYNGDRKFENGEEELDPIRQEIAKHFGVLIDADHILIIDNEMVRNQRHRRAFSVLIRSDGEKREAWYIDGRVPHATMLNRLYNVYSIPDDEKNEKHLGFLDADGFEDIEEIQTRATKRDKPIHWFIRETYS